MPKPYTRLEEPWLKEYLVGRYPDAPILQKGRAADVVAAVRGNSQRAVVFLEYCVFTGPGAVEAEAVGNIGGLAAKIKIARLDALIASPGKLDIWEARRNPLVGVVSTIERYASLLKDDPGLSSIADVTPSLHILVDINKPALAKLARAAGIEWVVFMPAWLRVQEAVRADAAAAQAMKRSAERRSIASGDS